MALYVLLLGRIALARCGLLLQMSSVVCLSVRLSVTTVSSAKAAELIVTPFEMMTRVSPSGNHVLSRGSVVPC